MRLRSIAVLPATLLAAAGVAQALPPSGGEALGAPPTPSSPTAPLAGAQASAEDGTRPRTPTRAGPRPHLAARVVAAVPARHRPGGRVVQRLGPATEFGSPNVLAVAVRRGRWLGVVSPTRPNGRLAWVRGDARGLRLRRIRWSLHADLSRREVVLRAYGKTVRRLAVAVGRPGSTTPTGRFAVTDKLRGSRFGPYYGCCILALSGHQPNTPPGWTGGDRLAIHGTDAPGTIGSASSAGCLRAADGDLRVLMDTVPVGTPVFIRR